LREAISVESAVKGSKMDSSKVEIAVFAGGCFWCMQHPFDKLNGVVSTSKYVQVRPVILKPLRYNLIPHRLLILSYLMSSGRI